MKLDDQILLSKHNNNYKIIILSGYLDEDENRLVANDLLGNVLYIDWDLSSYGQKKQHMFKYSHNNNALGLLMLEEDLLKHFDLTYNQDITLEKLKEVEKYLNTISNERAL